MTCARGGDIQIHELLHREAVTQVVAKIVEIVHAIGHNERLLKRLGLHVFLDAGMKKTNIGNTAYDDFAVEFQDQTQDTMGAGVLRPHVQDHGFTFIGPIRDQVPQFIKGDFHFRFEH